MDVNFFGASLRDLFGFQLPKGNEKVSRDLILRPSLSNQPQPIPSNFMNLSFVAPNSDDGALVYNYGTGGQISAVSFDDVFQNENQLINHYRRMSLYPECDSAIDDIINAMMVDEEDRPIASIRLDELKVSSFLKDRIREEFQFVKKLLAFQKNYYRIARRWYTDGRMFHHMMIDAKNPKKGLTELRYIDPRQIRKVRGVERIIDPRTKAPIVVDVEEFFLFNPLGPVAPTSVHGIPIAVDSVSYVHSGIPNADSTMMVSHLHKAIKPLNQLKIMEDAVVIYRITRAPERRVFYVDVGTLPTPKAEQYVKDLMNRFKNRLVYNSATGEVGDDRRYMAMQEDFWLPRREGGKGTEIETLPPGENLSKMEDVDYYLRQLYKSLNVPVSRLDPSSGFNLGRSAEISRDENKFTLFVNRLRTDFSAIFTNPLRAQLILKGVTTEEGWEEIKEYLKFDYLNDSYFSELKDLEIINQRMDAAEKADQFVGRYFSSRTVRRKYLRQTDEEINRINDEINSEKVAGQFSVVDGKVISNFLNNEDSEESETTKVYDGAVHKDSEKEEETNASQKEVSTKYNQKGSLSNGEKETKKVKSKPEDAPSKKKPTRRVAKGNLIVSNSD